MTLECPLFLEGFCNYIFGASAELVGPETFHPEVSKSKPKRQCDHAKPHLATF